MARRNVNNYKWQKFIYASNRHKKNNKSIKNNNFIDSIIDNDILNIALHFRREKRPNRNQFELDPEFEKEFGL